MLNLVKGNSRCLLSSSWPFMFFPSCADLVISKPSLWLWGDQITRHSHVLTLIFNCWTLRRFWTFIMCKSMLKAYLELLLPTERPWNIPFSKSISFRQCDLQNRRISCQCGLQKCKLCLYRRLRRFPPLSRVHSTLLEQRLVIEPTLERQDTNMTGVARQYLSYLHSLREKRQWKHLFIDCKNTQPDFLNTHNKPPREST